MSTISDLSRTDVAIASDLPTFYGLSIAGLKGYVDPKSGARYLLVSSDQVKNHEAAHDYLERNTDSGHSRNHLSLLSDILFESLLHDCISEGARLTTPLSISDSILPSIRRMLVVAQNLESLQDRMIYGSVITHEVFALDYELAKMRGKERASHIKHVREKGLTEHKRALSAIDVIKRKYGRWFTAILPTLAMNCQPVHRLEIDPILTFNDLYQQEIPLVMPDSILSKATKATNLPECFADDSISIQSVREFITFVREQFNVIPHHSHTSNVDWCLEVADRIFLTQDLKDLYKNLLSMSDYELIGDPLRISRDLAGPKLNEALATIAEIYGEEGASIQKAALKELREVENTGGEYFGLVHSFSFAPPLYFTRKDKKLVLSIRSDIKGNEEALEFYAYRLLVGGLRRACYQSNWDQPIFCIYGLFDQNKEDAVHNEIITRSSSVFPGQSDCEVLCCTPSEAKLRRFSKFEESSHVVSIPFEIMTHSM